jgi:hypothetical protein
MESFWALESCGGVQAPNCAGSILGLANRGLEAGSLFSFSGGVRHPVAGPKVIQKKSANRI